MKIDEEIMDQMAKDRERQEFRLEKILLNFTAEICARMEDLGINRAELAKRLGTSRAFVSKVMACNHNITLKTMDSISNALGMEIGIQVHVKKSIEEEMAAKSGCVLYKFEQPGDITTSSNRVVINESPGYPWLANQKPSSSIYRDNKQECGNDYDDNETKIA